MVSYLMDENCFIFTGIETKLSNFIGIESRDLLKNVYKNQAAEISMSTVKIQIQKKFIRYIKVNLINFCNSDILYNFKSTLLRTKQCN